MYLQIYKFQANNMQICWLVFTNKNYFVKIVDLKMSFTKQSQNSNYWKKIIFYLGGWNA
jgi:hypothetical protein